MDEPLSNLDAKLRVSMRAQLSRLHERLGVTTVYVTHDQVEAMTLGQRVAVLRGGVLQQCDTPEQLFDHPANLFVAAFIGSPAMNLVEAESRRRGALRLLRGARRRSSGRIVLGIRPHDLQARRPGIPRGRPGRRAARHRDPRGGGHRRAAAARRRAGRRGRRRAPDDDVLLAEDDRASFTVVPDARAPVAVGDRIELTRRPRSPPPLRRGLRQTQLILGPSPAVAGKLSRRAPSELVVHSLRAHQHRAGRELRAGPRCAGGRRPPGCGRARPLGHRR